jgi:hypothetical protein
MDYSTRVTMLIGNFKGVPGEEVPLMSVRIPKIKSLESWNDFAIFYPNWQGTSFRPEMIKAGEQYNPETTFPVLEYLYKSSETEIQNPWTAGYPADTKPENSILKAVALSSKY